MKKALALILACLMMAGILSACGNSDINPDSTAATTEAAVLDTTPVTESLYDQNGYLKDSLSSDINFGGKEINVLYWSDVERPEFEVEEQTGDLVKDAIYQRNMRVEERTGTAFNWVGQPGNFGNRANFIAYIENDINGGGELMMYAGYSLFAGTTAIRGFSRDLMGLDGLDFDKPWWPASFLDQVTLNNHVYFCTGDISTNTLYMMYCTFFTKELAEQYHITDLYDLAKNGQWTIDKMMEYASGVYSDLNGDAKKDYGSDQFGFMTADLHFDCFFNGSGLTALEKDADGKLVISETFGSEKTQDLIVKLCTYFKEAYCDVTSISSTNYDVAALSQGRCLFNVNRCYIPTWSNMKDPMGTYGILPVPKYDTDQESYITTMAFPHTQYSLSVAMSDEDANIVSTVLECMASESYRTVSPALFEMTMKLKYATGQEDSEMYDVIRNNVYIDLGRVFGEDCNQITYNTFRTSVKNASTAWTAQFKANSKVVEKKLAEINDAFASRTGE